MGVVVLYLFFALFIKCFGNAFLHSGDDWHRDR